MKNLQLGVRLIIIVFTLCLHLVLGFTIPGVKLNGINSSICTETEFASVDEFSLCLFVKLDTEKAQEQEEKTILSVTEILLNRTVILSTVENSLLIRVNESEFRPKRKCSLNKWCRVCVIMSSMSKKLSVGINYIQQNFKLGKTSKTTDEKYSDGDDEDDSEEDSLGDDNVQFVSNDDIPNVRLCIGATNPEGNPFIGEAAGVVLWSTKHLNITSDRCIEDFISEDFTGTFKDWHVNEGVMLTELQIFDVCMGTQQVMVIDSFVSYSEQIGICKSIQGRLLTDKEFPILLNYLASSSKNLCPVQNSSSVVVSSWFEANEEKEDALDVECPIFSYNGDNRTQPCIIESYCNVCIFPAFLEILLYGTAQKFDKKYTLKLDGNNRLNFVGTKMSYVQWIDNQKWVLKSSLHVDEWMLYNQTIPLGRKIWQNVKTGEKLTLAFTSCSENQFTCSDGSCLPFYSRCNGVVDCKDETDEENCRRIEKKQGYMINQLPPKTGNGTITEIFFYVLLYNIADISATDGKAVIDLVTVFAWRDPRLLIWNPKRNADVDCNEIWAPDIGLADGYPNGFQVDFKTYRSPCTIRSGLVVESKSRLTKSTRDPYMGRYVDGKREMIVRIFSGLATVSCRFNLRKYPFGKQICPITIWPDNALLEGGYKLSPYIPLQENKSEVYYAGRNELGEYYYKASPYKIVGNKTTIFISIELDTLSGYHILNSFTPSFLICLISYSTFFFPITNFNERIMVSLTALLVMAALFTQTNETSVKTPYFKYLDIWYVVLIIFGFLVVIFNTLVHNFQKIVSKVEAVGEKAEEFSKHEINEVDYHTWSRKANRLNAFIQIGFALILILFISCYCLAASGAM